MNENEFLPFTVLAGVAFGLALVWVLVQWLRADEGTEAIEREVKRHVERLVAPPKPDLPTLEPRVDPELARMARVYEAEEAALAKPLWTWGLAGTALGMVVGGIGYSFVGALLGAVGGSVLAVAGVVVHYALRGAATVAEPRAEAPGVATPQEPSAEVRRAA